MAVVSEAVEKTLTMTVNGREVKAAPGQTVLEVARSIGVEIPTLCHDDRLEPYGACRLCLVEVEGARGPVPACATKVGDGMTVQTNTDKIRRLRKFVIELLLSNHPLDCPICEAAGDCRLQEYAYEYEVSMSPWGWHPLEFESRDDHPNVARNPNRCILCGRCVRICRDVMGIGCWGFTNRGYDTIIDTPYNLPLEEVGCVSCGQCISTCPVGALSRKRSRYAARHWQTDKTRTICPYCGVGCELIVHTNRGKLVRVTADVGSGVNNGNLCVKGRFGMDYVNSEERLTAPLVRDENGDLVPTTWDVALDRIEQNFKRISAESGGAAFAALASAKATNEENYLMQKFARAVLGTNNVDHCTRLCHAPSIEGLTVAFGSGAMTNSFADISDADVIFVIGSNTTETHPVVALEIVRALRNGKKLIVADPRSIDLARKAHLHLAIRPGTNVALLKGMMRHIVDSGLEDEAFIAEQTEGYGVLRDSLQDMTVAQAADVCGVDPEALRNAAELYAGADAAGILCAVGSTQHESGTDGVLSMANLAMLCGNVGRPGTGVNHLRGQSNVQGACDMGGLPDAFSGGRRVDDPAAIAQMEAAWGVVLADRKPGKTLLEIMNAAAAGEIRAMYIMGENPALSEPDQTHVLQTLAAVGFLVVQDMFLTETAEYADVVLPASAVTERDGTFTNSERRVQRVRRAQEPLEGTMPDWRILQLVANRMGAGWEYDGPEDVMHEIASVTPEYGGITYERLEERGLQWPCPTADHPGTPVLHAQGFARGRGLFSAVTHRPPAEVADEEYPFVLITGRELEHYHTGTMSRRSPGLSGLVSEGRLQLNPADASRLGVDQGTLVRVTSRRGSIDPTVWVTDRVPPGCAFMPIHYSEAPANVLTHANLDQATQTPAVKLAAVRIERIVSTAENHKPGTLED